jgi:hypothetical protein
MAKDPNEVGQSGTARPASLLVTRAPAIIRTKVVQATKVANRWWDRLYGVVRDFRTRLLFDISGSGLPRQPARTIYQFYIPPVAAPV